MHSSSELVPYVDATLPPDGLAILPLLKRLEAFRALARGG